MSLRQPMPTSRALAPARVRQGLAGASPSRRTRSILMRVKDPSKSLSTQLDTALNSELVTPTFAAVLQEALSRNLAQTDDIYDASASYDERDAAPQASRAVIEVLETAIATSQVTMRRLVSLQAAVEAEVATEQKQQERLRFLLDKLQRDYAYFNTLEKLQHQRTSGGSSSSGGGGSGSADNGSARVSVRRRTHRELEPQDDVASDDDEDVRDDDEDAPGDSGYRSSGFDRNYESPTRELERSRHRSWRTQATDEPLRERSSSRPTEREEPPLQPAPRRSWRTRLPSRVTESAAERRGFSSWEEMDAGF